MSKSIPMLPSLAGGSGVAAHTLVDTDLMWVVDANTLDADRDRKMTLGELKAFLLGVIPPVVIVDSWTVSAGITVAGTTKAILYPDNSLHIYMHMSAIAAPFSGTGTVAYVSGDVFGLASGLSPQTPFPFINFDFRDNGLTNARYRGHIIYHAGSNQTRIEADDSVLGIAVSAQVVIPKF